MRIVLAEERAGQRQAERAFNLAVVKVGRDPAECQIIFDQAQWPMVSRRHAEFRLKDGQCLLVDTNSSFGTFLNGRRITEPIEIRAGASVQFGAGGPVIHVVSIDATMPQPAASDVGLRTRRMEREEDASLAPPPIPKGPNQQAPTGLVQPVAAQSQPAFIELVNTETGRSNRIQIDKDVMRIGRDPAGDVVIDAAAAAVSRHHAEVRKQNGRFALVDLGSFNGTVVNGQRITQPVQLYDGDQIQLGTSGPTLRFIDPAHPAPADKFAPGQRSAFNVGEPAAAAPSPPSSGPLGASGRHMHTMVAGHVSIPPPSQKAAQQQQPQFLMQRGFDGRPHLSIGRASDNDIRLDGLQISNYHARVKSDGSQVSIEDAGSTNGVYLNGQRISGRRPIGPQDVVQIGPFLLQTDPRAGVAIFDTRSKTRIDAIDITKIVPNRSGGGQIKLLDDVDLTIQPNEFVGLLGPSGAGKSTLMDALNGMRPASGGHVLVNNLDLYQHLDSLKQSIGYVPQDDIIHRELTVYRTLYYVARLRLSRDVSTQEIDQIVGEVMDVTGLTERRDVPVSQLSGGQRKRVSIAVELITKPSIIFLDEPTSGLDPATEEKIMRLFRQIAESGRTVILTTHAMENVRLFDKIVLMMRGKLVFYGTPEEALAHVGADSFKDLYDRLETPINEQLKSLPPTPPNATREQKAEAKLRKEQIAERVAEEWRQRFQHTDIYRRNIVEPLGGLKREAQVHAPARRRATVTDALRQWGTLTRRYLEVLGRDKLNLLILFAQAPIIAFLTYFVVSSTAPRDFPYFVLALVAVWFGTSVAAREIIRERAVYTRERMVNLGLLPYVSSKLFVLSIIVGLQCIMLYGSLKLMHYAGLMKLPGWALPQLLLMIITGMVGIALGLFISAIVKTSEMATSLVPLILIPQILFSGLVGVPTGFSRVIGLAMPATWSFDEMKRLSTLDTLREEGSDPQGPNKGRGLYKHIEDVNDQNIKQAREDVDRYKSDAEANSKEYERKMKDYIAGMQRGEQGTQPAAPKLGNPPQVPAAEKIGEDLSDYVDFLHPWGNILLDPIVLLVMFFSLIIATILALKAQDIG